MPYPTIFISYSHKDDSEKQALLTHLGVLQSEKLLDLWVDDQIGAGSDWNAEIEQAIRTAKVAILLITANFLTSPFILNEEVPKLLKRRQEEGLVVFPIIAKPCAWEKVSWLSRMNLRPKNGRPIWREGGQHVDEELASIAREVANIIESFKAGDPGNIAEDTPQTYLVPEELQYLLEIQSRINFKDEIVDQNVVPIFVRELDLAGIRANPLAPTTFSSFTEELIKTGKNTILIGEAGIGKTTELLKLTKQLSLNVISHGKDPVIPVYVELRHFTSAASRAEDLIEHIFNIARISSEQQRQAFLSQLKKGKQFIFILDGLNEVRSEYRSESVNAIISFIKLYPNSQYVISTRYYGFDEQFLNINGIPFGCSEIQLWNDTQLKLFFDRNNALDGLKAMDPKLNELCRIPFIAHLLLDVIRSKQYDSEKYPKNKGELYKSYVDYIFTRRDSRVGRFSRDEKVYLLANLAYSMNKQGTLSWRYKSIKSNLGAGIPNAQDAEMIKEIIKNGILKQGDVHFLRDLEDETPIEFLHQSLQEYFTALYIVQKPDREFDQYLPTDNLENIYWRDIPIYLAGLLERPLDFISSLLGHEKHDDYLLIVAKCLVSCNCDPVAYQQMLDTIIQKHLVGSMQNDYYTKDAIEIVNTLGEEAIELLLSHLDNADEITEVRALTGDETIERRWRKYGRIIYILGELHADRLVDKLSRVYRQVKDIHLLYHIVIALYTLKSKAAIELLRDDFFKTHSDPLVRTFSVLAGLNLAPQDTLLIGESKELVQALTRNINNQNEMEYALRAHSAEALGLLGLPEAVEPLANLLRNEKRVEPQSSAVKALGYVATQCKQAAINMQITDALLEALVHGTIYKNRWGKKLARELLTYMLSKDDTLKLTNAIQRINISTEDETVKQSKKEIIEDVIQATQTR